MKRIFLLLTIFFIVLSLMIYPCFAEETTLFEEEYAEGGEDGEQVLNLDWLTAAYDNTIAYIDEYSDQIMTAILLVVVALFKRGTDIIVKKFLPSAKEQIEKTFGMAQAAGAITQTNQKNFEKVVEDFKNMLLENEEREARMAEALLIEKQTCENYQQVCQRYEAQIKEFAAVSLAEATMMYETLMSAQLTDVRKEEIERQYLKMKHRYEEILAETEGGETDENLAS